MTNHGDLLPLASSYHEALPARIRDYLNGRGITDEVIDLHVLGWDGQRITIPIPDRTGRIAFFKLAKDPEDRSRTPKMITPAGATAELYGWERLRVKPLSIVICEGEFDRLVLEGQGFGAVTSTGGAGVFRKEWTAAFLETPEIYVCFDRDEAGRRGAEGVARMIPQARIVRLPEEVGSCGDVTDLFVRLGKTREDFVRLLDAARPLSPGDAPPSTPLVNGRHRMEPDAEVMLLKGSLAIEDLIGRYVPLRRSGKALTGLCPFHDDHRPSLVVYPEHKRFHCFGCSARGDVFDFLKRIENLSFPEALVVARKLVGNHERGPEEAR